MRARTGMTRRRAVCVSLLGAITLLGILPATGASAAPAPSATVKIFGRVGNVTDPATVTVMFLPTKASAKLAKITPISGIPGVSGNFTLTVARKQIAGASLHLMRRGQYLAPVTLRFAGGKGYMRFAAIPATTNSIQLPKTTVYGATSYAKSVPSLAANRVDQTHPVGVNAVGTPRGAGRLGFIRKLTTTTGVRALDVQALAVAPCATSASPDAGAGGDCDADGIPNAIDVDDNGNLTLDMTDPLSAGSTAKLNPWTSMGFGMSNTLNANVRDGLTPETINAAIGGDNTFQVYFFVGQPYLTTSANPLDAVWVDCGLIAWCAPGNSHAIVSGVSETPNFPTGEPGPPTDTLWEDYHGQSWTGGVPTDFPETSPTNALFRMDQGGGSTWVAAVQPRDGDQALAEITPGQVFRLRYRTSPIATASELPMMLNPYAVSIPALKSYQVKSSEKTEVNYADPNPAGNNGISAIDLASESTVHLEFWRPQRLPIGDEVGFQDLGKLHYGVSLGLDGIGGGPERGCSSAESAGYYSEVSSNFSRTPDPDNEFAMNLWPLTDKSLDQPTNFANTAGFTLDVRQCLADQSVEIPPEGADVRVSLVAASEQLTGGANRATQSFVLHLDGAGEE